MVQPKQPQRREFAPTEHLSSEAVAAFAADQLAATARARALRHLGQCADCMAEVHEQRAARHALRNADPVPVPGSLAARLADLPRQAALSRAVAQGNSLVEGTAETWRQWWFAREV